MSDFLQQAVLALMLISMMFAMGLRLSIEDLRRALSDRVVVGVCVALNFVVLPVLAVVLVRAFALSPSASAGFLLCAAAPGATMTTLLSRNANADVPVAVGLLLLLVLLSAVMTPPLAQFLFVQVGLPAGEMDALGAVVYLLAIQIVPLIVGMSVRARSLSRAEALEPKVSRFATIVLLVVIVGMTLANTSLVREVGWRGMVAMALFLLVAALSGLVVRRPVATKVACSFAFGAQNIALATLLAKRYLDDEGLIMVLLFGLVTYLILLPLVPVFRGWIARSAASS